MLCALALLLLGCGAKPEQKPAPQPATTPTPSTSMAPISMASIFGKPKLSAKFSTKSERISPDPAATPTSAPLPPCPEGDDGACLVERLGEDELGPLKQGLAAKEVLTLLKAAEKKSAIEEEGATGLFVQQWEYPKLGISLGLAADTKKGAQTINTLSISAPCAYKTKRGMGLGSTLDELKSAYQNAMSKDDLARNDPEGSYIAGSVYGGISFQLKGGKVASIFMGAMAE
jgi:hypothetical protein